MPENNNPHMEQTELKRIVNLILKVREGFEITPEEGSEIDRYQEQHPESKVFLGAILRDDAKMQGLVQMSARLLNAPSMSIESIRELFDTMDPMKVIEELNNWGYEVALLNWRHHYAVAEFSFNEYMGENERQFVFEIDDYNWHPTPKDALKAYFDQFDT